MKCLTQGGQSGRLSFAFPSSGGPTAAAYMPYDISYEYDAAGNRTRKVDNLTAAVTTYTYDAANQLQTEQTAGGTTTYTFDAAGNMATIATPSTDVTTYVWDAENRRTAVQTPGGSTEAAYNADGLRVRMGDTQFLWDGQAYLAETDLAASTQTLYTVQPSRFGRLISQKRSSSMGSEWFHFDALGSTVNVSDQNQTVPERYIYDAWGNLLSSNSFKPGFLFVGSLGYHHNSSDSLLYVRQRWLNPSLAAFVSRDSRGFGSQGDRYIYVDNQPVKLIDPSGNRPVTYIPGRGSFEELEMKGAISDTVLSTDILASWTPNVEAFGRHTRRCCNIGWASIQNKTVTATGINSGLVEWLVNTQGWEVDSGVPYRGGLRDRPRSGDPRKGTTITFYDGPEVPKGDIVHTVTRVSHSFETCVICLDGLERIVTSESAGSVGGAGVTVRDLAQMVVYGCFTWSLLYRFDEEESKYVATRSVTVGDGPKLSASGVERDEDAKLVEGTNQFKFKGFPGLPPSSTFEDTMKAYYHKEEVRWTFP